MRLAFTHEPREVAPLDGYRVYLPGRKRAYLLVGWWTVRVPMVLARRIAQR